MFKNREELIQYIEDHNFHFASLVSLVGGGAELVLRHNPEIISTNVSATSCGVYRGECNNVAVDSNRSITYNDCVDGLTYLSSQYIPTSNPVTSPRSFVKESKQSTQCRYIPKVIWNDPAIILLNGKDKFVSKCSGEAFDPIKGLLMCLAKKHGITNSHIKSVLRHRGIKDSVDAELCYLYDKAEENGYNKASIIQMLRRADIYVEGKLLNKEEKVKFLKLYGLEK